MIALAVVVAVLLLGCGGLGIAACVLAGRISELERRAEWESLQVTWRQPTWQVTTRTTGPRDQEEDSNAVLK
jgi:hypothetical protein